MKREVLAAQARMLIEHHGDDWDSPHALVTLHPDGNGGLRPHTWVAIMLDIHPLQFPGLISRTASEALAKHPEDPPYAYGFLSEGFGMKDPGPDAPPEEQERFRRARDGGTFHEQPEAYETADAWVADVYGRLWHCRRYRATGEVGETFHAAGVTVAGGHVSALAAIARKTGVAAWGVAPRSGGMN
jgi:hypothetical protein